MAWFTIQRTYDLLHRPRRLNFPRWLWRRTLRELRDRGAGVRESGGLLLGNAIGECRYAREFIPYDEIDPEALQGIIVFDASRMNTVWDRCERKGMQVVADVHTHPGGYGQSSLDQAHPMIPQSGHLALIVPDYASRASKPGGIGIYEFLGDGRWRDHSRDGGRFIRLGWI